MPEPAMMLIPERFRFLLLGGLASSHTQVAEGHFYLADQRQRLIEAPESLYSKRPFEVEWVEETEPDATGPSPINQTLYDSSGTVVVRVGYLQGGGTAGGGDVVSVQDEMARDGRDIRRVLQDQANWDSDTTGLVSVLRKRHAVKLAIPPDRRALLEMEYRVRYQETEPVL